MSYYLVASLPPLVPGDQAPWTPEAFGFHCQGTISAAEWQELMCLIEDRLEEGQSDFVAWWQALDTQIRNQQARTRATRLSVESRSYIRMHAGFDVRTETAVAEALALTNPLEREQALDRARWAALDDRTRETPFGIETVYAYAIRLRLLHRWHDLTDEAGLERVEEFITEYADKSIELQRLGES